MPSRTALKLVPNGLDLNAEHGSADTVVPQDLVPDDVFAMPASQPEVGAKDTGIAEETGLGLEKVTSAQLRVSAAKRKKKKRAMKIAAPAETVTRGFQTPIASGGEESDFSLVGTPILGPLQKDSPMTRSPSVGPSTLTRGLSAMRLQLDTLSLDSSPRMSSSNLRELGASDKSVTGSSGSDDDGNGAKDETYEVSLENDFVSPEMCRNPRFEAIEGGLRTDSPHRKMTASDFEPLKCLGKGTYGTVILVKQHSTGRLFAQKQFKKASLTVHKRLVEQTMTERAILESVNRHPFVVKLYYAFQDRQKLYLLLEYAQGGELFHHLAMERMFSEEVAAFYMAEMILALDHLHTHLGVVYRDLKPENCLLDAEGHLLLTDFGLSKVAVDEPPSPGGSRSSSTSRCTSIIGTVDYMAPEVVQGREYDAAVDWWSLGAVGFDLLTGSPPFSAPNHAKTQHKIVHSKPNMPYYLSPDAKDLLTRLLRKEPRKRLGGNMPKDLATMKAHRFFRRVDWKALQTRDCTPPIQPIVTDPAAAENFSTTFTELAMSPAEEEFGLEERMGRSPLARGESAAVAVPVPVVAPGLGVGSNSVVTAADGDLFGGFTYVASSSLLEIGN